MEKEKDEKINQALLRNKDIGFRIAPPFSVNQSATAELPTPMNHLLLDKVILAENMAVVSE
jgi:hypothetical protein